MGEVAEPARRLPPGVAVVLVAALSAYGAQQVLFPTLAPLTRELGLREVDLGLVIGSAALMLMLVSRVWGGLVPRLGHRTVLLTGMTIATVGLAGFAGATVLATTTDLPRWLVLTLFMLTRGLVFGVGLTAVPVAAMAFVSSVSHDPGERTRLVGLVGATQGASMAIGPAVGGLLGALLLLLPVYAAPVLLAAATVVAWRVLPSAPGGRVSGPRVRVRARDPRVAGFLGFGFLVFLALSQVQVAMGFMYQDRLGLTATTTALYTGIAAFAIGVTLVTMQAGAVPRLGWSSRRLMATGALAGLAGYVLLLLAGDFWSLTAGFVVVAVGMGLAVPGYQAGATLAVGDREQGAVAGLLSSVLGATFVAGPVVGAALYQVDQRLPTALGAALMLAALGVALAAVATARRVVREEHAASAAPATPTT